MGEFEKFYNKALRFLSFRPRSEKEIIDNLKKRKASLPIIEKVISKLKEQNFVNDLEFAKWWIEQRDNFKPRSERLLKLELKQKGIEGNILESLDFLEKDLGKAKKLVEKRIKNVQHLAKHEAYQKLQRFLVAKGFNFETIKEAIDEVYEKIYNRKRQEGR